MRIGGVVSFAGTLLEFQYLNINQKPDERPGLNGGLMKLLIIGATGGTGQELVKQALEQGHIVTVLVNRLL